MLFLLTITIKLCTIFTKDGDYMRKIKFFIMAFVLVGIMFLFSGCAYYSSYFDFEFNGEYMADKYVDLLIPLDETDELYTDFNHENIIKYQGKKDLTTEIPENSEIVNYNKNGYRSMLVHTKDSSLDIMIKDSESIPDYNEKYNGTPHEVTQLILLPDELFYKYQDEYGETAFLKFCNKYKKCYVAIFDKDGNILQISKKIPLVSLGNFYLQDISYDVENNKIKPTYKASVEMLIFVNIVGIFATVGMIGCIITLIVDKVNQNKPIVSYRGYIIASSIFNIPTALFIIAYIYCAFGLSLTITDFFIYLFIKLLSLNIRLVFIPVNIGVLVHFIRFEKKLRLKRYLEEKHRAESLDNSEKR